MNKILSTCAATLSALFLNAASVQAQTPAACPVYEDLVKFDYPLPLTARDIAAGKPIRIVALGSSSTFGYGASDAAYSYPSQLQNKLRARFPKADITVINRGKGGDMTKEMSERLEDQVIKENPQLVILQTGANEVLKDGSIADAEKYLTHMLVRIRSLGIDVVLMDNQYAPAKMDNRAGSAPMQSVLENASYEFAVPLMKRHDLMKRWNEKSGVSMDAILQADGYHLRDWAYGCVADTLERGITTTIKQPPVIAFRRP